MLRHPGMLRELIRKGLTSALPLQDLSFSSSVVAGPQNWWTHRVKEDFENINTVCVSDGCWTLDRETSGKCETGCVITNWLWWEHWRLELADWPGLDCNGDEDDDVVDTALDHQCCQALDISTWHGETHCVLLLRCWTRSPGHCTSYGEAWGINERSDHRATCYSE